MPSKRLPSMHKVGGRWVIENFDPPADLLVFRRLDRSVATLYVLECAGFFKIGLASNFKTRFSTINTSNPLPVSKFAIRSVPKISVGIVEAWLHRWFSASSTEIKAALPEALRIGKVYEAHCLNWLQDHLRDLATPEAKAWAKKAYVDGQLQMRHAYAASISDIDAKLSIMTVST